MKIVAAGEGAGPALIFQGQHLTAEDAPAFALFESWAPPASTLAVFVSGIRSKLHLRLVAIKGRYPAAWINFRKTGQENFHAAR